MPDTHTLLSCTVCLLHKTKRVILTCMSEISRHTSAGGTVAVISTAGAGPTAPMMGARLWEGEPGLLDPDEGPPGGPCSDSHAAKPRMPFSQQARSAARITSALGCSVSKQHSHLRT